MSRRELGPDHPEVGGRASSLAYWLTEEGKYDEAGLLVDEALAIRRKALGPGASAGRRHAHRQGQPDAGDRSVTTMRVRSPPKRVASSAASMPADSWQVAAAMNAEGAAQVALGRFEQAEPLLVDSLAALGRAPIPGLETRGKQRLVELYEAWGKPEQARKARQALASPK